jgi:Mg2+ and Co2+ transporter CorA
LFFWHQKDGNWIGAESGGLRGLYELLETYARAIDVHEAVVDDADTAKEIFTILRHAGPLSRSARNLHLALQEAAVKFPKDKELRMLRDRAHENERAAELLYADARVALEFYRAERAEEQAQSSDRLAKIGFRLNLLAGFFLPLVALGGLMGMNVNLPPFVQNSFWGIFFGGLSIGLILVTLVGYRTGYKASREDQNKE